MPVERLRTTYPTLSLSGVGLWHVIIRLYLSVCTGDIGGKGVVDPKLPKNVDLCISHHK
jgi:hypothetical protein